ncbi:hypothetical protein THIOSC15_30002 [uncultured Thiomicrorhabdus sp.]
MNQQYDNTNRGALFVNNRKQTENHPDYTGSVHLSDGKEYWLSAWKKQSQSGNTFLSISIGQEKLSQGQQQGGQQQPQQQGQYVQNGQPMNPQQVQNQQANGFQQPQQGFTPAPNSFESDDMPF